ncbi:MAG: Holliday junction branch migration protein RuvA [Cyanobacteria bacterium PR.023]|jgi:Holliday junction DNA helicase RuvA|nr:Holliday junction branch migration protein RuvA [Cyanobacteria bacterium PR.023]MDQ5933435.1 holliday junction helicase RuvA [Cyanobacteriota bacterium erpe_2018_sw_21hr_WHONDRS-SW48-000092_B_bin.40]
MLAYLKGVIVTKEISGGPVDRLVLDVNDVGYELSVAHSTLLLLGQVGETVIVYTSIAIRETEWTIFGFRDTSERQLFNLLQSVTGIGPKLALGLVGTLGIETLVEAVLSENQKMISQAPGVGAKVAQRIILELKTKMEEFSRTLGSKPLEPFTGKSAVFEEVTEILANLGYTATEIHAALKKAKEKNIEADSAEELVRFALRALSAPQSA